MVSHIARDLGIEASVLRRWVNQEREGVLDMRPNRPIRSEAATEVERLQRELRRVTIERDILKKALLRSTGQSNTLAASVSAGVAKPRVLRGRVLSFLATASSCR